jgi:hypothetical protein
VGSEIAWKGIWEGEGRGNRGREGGTFEILAWRLRDDIQGVKKSCLGWFSSRGEFREVDCMIEKLAYEIKSLEGGWESNNSVCIIASLMFLLSGIYCLFSKINPLASMPGAHV